MPPATAAPLRPMSMMLRAPLGGEPLRRLEPKATEGRRVMRCSFSGAIWKGATLADADVAWDVAGRTTSLPIWPEGLHQPERFARLRGVECPVGEAARDRRLEKSRITERIRSLLRPPDRR